MKVNHENQLQRKFFSHRLATATRRRQTLKVFITAAVERETAYFALVIYEGRRRVAAFSDWLDTTAERAWLYGYQLACEFRDSKYPSARLVIRSTEEAQQRRRYAA